MNREKNYNRVFNVNPQIGILDPLKGKRRPLISTTPSAMRFSSAPNLVPYKTESNNSLPTISSISSLNYKDHPRSSPQLSSQSLHDHTLVVQNDYDTFGLTPSPPFHKPHYTTPCPTVLSSKRPLKFLSDELPDRTNPKNTGKPLQSPFTSIPNTVVA